ncbi:MAG: hypothetical protein GXP63_00825 [DPANN group archaeon]|nr:hypothetical protein [DPANN group archaeon]
MGDLGKIIGDYRKRLEQLRQTGRQQDNRPEEQQMITQFKKDIRLHMEPDFSYEKLQKVRRFAEPWLRAYFNIPQGDFSNIVTGAERIMPYQGKEGKKIVLMAGPHNSHLDDVSLYLALYACGIGDLSIGARTNMFMGKGDQLRELGAFAISFFEKMPYTLVKAAQEEIEDLLEQKILEEANRSAQDKESPHWGQPTLFASNGRSYFGKIDEKYPPSWGRDHQLIKIRRNLEKLLRIQGRHERWDILVYPVSLTQVTVPEQPVLHHLPALKRLNTTAYQIADYGTILVNMFIRKELGSIFHYPQSDIFIDIHEEVDLKEYRSTSKEGFDKSIKELTDLVQSTIKKGYRILPEKLLATAVVSASAKTGKHRRGRDEKRPGLRDVWEAFVDYHERAGDKNVARRAYEQPADQEFQKALSFYTSYGALKVKGEQLVIKNMPLMVYQANTIAHHLSQTESVS